MGFGPKEELTVIRYMRFGQKKNSGFENRSRKFSYICSGCESIRSGFSKILTK